MVFIHFYPEFYKSYEVEDKRISTTFVTEFTDINNGKQYVYDPDNIAEPSFPLCHFAKYLDPNDNQSTSAGDYSCNRKIIRYADVLLMQSEAYCEMNRIGDALTGINRVRARAGLNPILHPFHRQICGKQSYRNVLGSSQPKDIPYST